MDFQGWHGCATPPCFHQSAMHFLVHNSKKCDIITILEYSVPQRNGQGWHSLIKVMIVDDERTIREGVRSAIDWQQHGLEVCATAASGAEAFEAIENDPPDIVLLDIVLNDIDGLEVLDLIRRKYPAIYVILISGHDDFEYAQRAIELSAYCYLLKPVDIAQLLEKLLQIRSSIEQRMDKLKKDSELNDRLKESIPIIRDSFFQELVNGKCTSVESITAKSDFLGVDLAARQYAVALVELHGAGNGDEYDRNLIRYATVDLCRDAFAGVFKCHPFNMEGNIGLLICSDDLDPVRVRGICTAIRDDVNGKLEVPLTIGIGAPQCGPLSIQHSYREAAEALEYKILMGLNRVIDPDIIYKTSNKLLERNLVKEVFLKRGDELKVALRNLNRKVVDSVASDIIAAMRESIDSNFKNRSRDLLLMSTYLSMVAIDLDVNTELIAGEGEELYLCLRSKETMEKIRECICLFFAKIMAELKARQQNCNSQYVSKALDCIRENLYGELSLSTIADTLYLSPNYLSRIFKQEVGEPFIEYTVRVKMNEAKRLLEQSSRKVYEIANELNYKDVNYFSKTFKKIFGVSPSEYRELQ